MWSDRFAFCFGRLGREAQMVDDQTQMGGKGKITAILVSLVAITGLLVTLLGNIDGIVKNAEKLFGYAPGPPSASTAPSPPAPIGQTPAIQTPPQVAAPAPKKVFKICMGNGGGENCLNGADAKYDCNTYRAFGGGGAQTYTVLADMFCSYTNAGPKKIYPHDIIVIQDNGGGECVGRRFR
jgi:hypothetical protein